MKGPGVATSPHPIRALFQCICLCKGKRENGNSGLCSWDIQREIFCEEPGKKALRAVAVKPGCHQPAAGEQEGAATLSPAHAGASEGSLDHLTLKTRFCSALEFLSGVTLCLALLKYMMMRRVGCMKLSSSSTAKAQGASPQKKELSPSKDSCLCAMACPECAAFSSSPSVSSCCLSVCRDSAKTEQEPGRGQHVHSLAVTLAWARLQHTGWWVQLSQARRHVPCIGPPELPACQPAEPTPGEVTKALEDVTHREHQLMLGCTELRVNAPSG
ncbi:hypothetical protein Anapl_03807 [Anas platyrhynchos]|uniref:Uncharacterized protein n=1 Tax=Anas platyrhynchos TaxID=8839 RepID=R0LQ08_ANAPL|nr:hypothetical protein Anapl_03807 [Anas platyrhynchos]